MNDNSSSSSSPRSRVLLFTGILLASLGTASAAEPPPWHYVARLGLHDARHTDASGFQGSDVFALSDGSYAIGTSDLFVGTDDVSVAFGRRAQSAWVAGPTGNTTRIGLYDTIHTRDDGRQESYPRAVNNNGVSIGASTRFLGHVYGGASAWVATASGSTLRIGFYDAVHTASDGGTYSEPVALNAANKLIGFSENPETGHRSGWIANSIGQINAIGITDADHTSSGGRPATFPVALNDNGYIIGNSDFYAVSEIEPGATAWLRRPDRSMRIVGFQTGVHRAPNGQHLSRAEYLTQSGYIGGFSDRYGTSSTEPLGQTAWVTQVDGPNRPVGIYTGTNLGANGVAHSHIDAINEAGYAIGTSIQYEGENPNEFDQAGATSWIATPSGTTVRIGFYDAEHSVNGHQFNTVVALNASDALVGYAARYASNGDYFGSDAFVANAAGYTTKIGLTDATHTRADGYHASFATALTNASGYVAGYTERYAGGTTQVGQTAWIYTRGARTYVRLELSVRASDGYAESTITDLREDGSAIGRFRLFAGDGSDQGERAFVYIPGKGAFLLNDQLDVSASSAGWAYFADAVATNANGFIVGSGVRAAGTPYGAGVYLVNEEAATSATAQTLLKIRIKLP